MMHIRRATADDAELLARLNAPVQQLHYEARPDFYKPPALTAELIADFRERLLRDDICAFVAEEEGEPIGYLLAHVTERADNPYSYATRRLVVDQISVNPDQRSKGCGERLMQEAFALAKSPGIETFALGVWAFNERAIAFYQRLGFNVRDLHMETTLE